MDRKKLIIIALGGLYIVISFVLQSVFIAAVSISIQKRLEWFLLFMVSAYVYLFVSCFALNRGVGFMVPFLLLSVLFNFGQHFVVVFHEEFFDTQNLYFINLIPPDIILRSSFFIIRCLSILMIGYAITTKIELGIYERIPILENKPLIRAENKWFDRIGWSLFIVSVIPAFYRVFFDLSLNQSIGYLERRSVEIGIYKSTGGFIAITDIIAPFFFPALYMLMIGSRKKWQLWLLYGIVAFYTIIMVQTGTRYKLFIFAMALYLIRYIWHVRLRRRTVAMILVCVFLALFLLPVISDFRNTVGMTGSDYLKAAMNIDFANMLYRGLWESGITFIAIANVIKNCPSVIPYSWGSSVIASILATLPSFLRGHYLDVTEFRIGALFSPLYFDVAVGHGSSFIAEAYYNFGPFSSLVILLYGILLGFAENAMRKAKLYRNKAMFFVIVLLLGELTYGVRSDLYHILRTVVYYGVVPIVLVKGLTNLDTNKL